LPLAGSVIHERKKPHIRAFHQLFGFRYHQRHRHLAAQMQKVLDAQQLRVARGGNGVGENPGLAVDVLGALLPPHPQRIEHSGDAGGRELAVVGHHRGDRVPVHLRPRHVVRLEMIGVQLDEAGQQQVARQILDVIKVAARRLAAFADRDDAAVRHRDGAARDHLVGEDDAGVREEKTGDAHEPFLERDDFSSNRHPALPFPWSMIFSENRYPLFGIMLYAATAKRVTSMRVSAIAARTSSSCTMATIAAPRRFRSRTRSTTTARLPASSEAVGSSSRSTG
jgi:hypothetical protein